MTNIFENLNQIFAVYKKKKKTKQIKNNSND